MATGSNALAIVDSPTRPILYRDRGFDIDAAKITPGDYFVTGRDMLIVTVLGSCVSACIRDPKLRIGGMNHFMLPEYSRDAEGLVGVSARYGAYAMEILINQLLKLGAQRKNLEVKVFGAGKVLAGLGDIGQRNAEFVREYLRLEKIRLAAEDLGGIYPRKVYFFPYSGRVLVKQLRSVSNNTIFIREKAYSESLQTKQVGGDVEFF